MYKYDNRVDEIIKTLGRVAKMIGDTVDVQRIAMTAEVLDKNIPDDDALVQAFDTVIMREKRFPPPATFIEYAGVSYKARAQDALEKVFRAVKVYGSGDPNGARRFLGEPTWRTLESCGGWTRFCLQQDLNIEVFRSQFINSFVDRVPFLEASGEVRREFLSSKELTALAEAKDLNRVLTESRSGPEGVSDAVHRGAEKGFDSQDQSES